MTVRYVRRGGLPPQDDETLSIDEAGRFQLWRTVGWARAGRFGGQLSASELDRLASDSAAVRGGESFSADPPLDAAVESIEVDGVSARMGHHAQPTGAWGPLTKRLRKLVDRLTDSPVAAIELAVDAAGRSARLRHIGSAPIDVGLGKLIVEAHLLDAKAIPLDAWTADQKSPDIARVSASAGWAYELPMEHAFKMKSGQQLQVWAMFDLFDGPAPKRGRLVAAAKIG